ncbi:43 kDa receptor-associated protein of the synapse homolog [Drosophila albomicans]|uniref:43 kDa receptor-associated protein of the synapse homolog n=1 Tax=Drosophila albomicans TaxID=7291 RepID=A0A6P8XH32_DROAB|nr:43 kDa receptor-associated protein of the synapse homolog [Drosophila albomicans]XP_034112095.1 43 kDa receptor-associated protein of the synapse homolog [Drosophila albomicans]XP_034112096.1 43 kDa receptor-associated protein of the synapse homolog [Drosophila albomicans]
MSWESIVSKDLLSIPRSTNLSATHLLASPDGSRYLLDHSNELCQLEENYSRLAGCGSSPEDGGSRSLWIRHGFARSDSGNTVISCFWACQRSLRQYIAKRKIERGLRLYEQHNQTAAVRTWRSALKGVCRREDCFQLLGYLYQAHMDWGKYRDAIDFGHQQLGISEELDSPNMRAETYLNLSRAHASLGGLERALSYARHSLYNESGTKCRSGLVHLTVARVYLEMGGFSRALEGLQGAHKIAMAIGDPSLELQVYVALSELFGRLQDNDKSATYASKAYDLSRSLQLGDLNSCHHRAALLRMAASLRKQGDLGDAHDYCMEATRLSLISGDQATYMRSIRVMGDIYRKKMDIDRAFRQYEQAMGTSSTFGDRMAQMEAMDGAARCLETLRLQSKICNCRPLEFNTRLLEVASSIGAKFLVRKIRSRLALIYRALGDEDQCNTHLRLADQTDAALGLKCGACGEVFGLQPANLEALPCAHILHAKCAHEIWRHRDKNAPMRSCPACHKILNSHLHLCENGSGPENDNFDQSSLSLNANGFNLDGFITLNPENVLPPLPNQTAKESSVMFCNGLKNKSMPSIENTVFLSTSPYAAKAVYRSNLSLASLSIQASNLTIDSERNATSSV